MLSMAMNDLIYRGIIEKAIDPDSNDMRMKERGHVYVFASQLIFMDPLIMSCEHKLRIYVMSKGRRHVSRGVKIPAIS
jgi:hypothetical protein